jgi:type II secretory pathway component GspD/PulD (secretin)
MWRSLRIVLALWMGLAVTAHAQQTVLEVITLKYRNAEQVMPVLRPLLAPQGTMTGLNNQLIVRTTPANLDELKRVLETVDGKPRRLLISVRQDADLAQAARGAQVSGRVDIGDNATVSVPGRPTPPGAAVRVDGVRAKVYSSQSARSDSVVQQVQVIEGGRALIRVGQSAPVVSRQVTDGPGGTNVTRTTEFVQADTGFYVVPRLAGDQVTLEIFTAADSLRSDRPVGVNVQQVQTVVSGRLGQWMEIGGVDQHAAQRDAELLARSRDARSDTRRVLVKVDEIQ